MSLASFIKIRIGEPITALAIDQGGIAFGAISGYIGYHDFTTKKTVYLPEVFDEIVRSMYWGESKTLFASVGDLYVVQVNFSNPDAPSYEKIRFSFHSSNYCPSTLTFVANNYVVLVPLTSFQNKEQILASETIKKNPGLYIDLISKNEIQLQKMETPQACIPFDFDGRRLLWLEYAKDKTRFLSVFDCEKQIMETKVELDRGIERISLGRLVRNAMIYVENQVNIKLFEFGTGTSYHLYSHEKPVIAIDIWGFAELGTKGAPPAIKPGEIVMKEEGLKKLSKGLEGDVKKGSEDVRLVMSGLKIMSLDTDGTVKVHKNQTVQQTLQLSSAGEYPHGIYPGQFFDMGYPYYLKANDNSFVVSSDYGIILCHYKS